MAEDQDWRLRTDIADAQGLLAGIREAGYLKREMKDQIGPDVVLSSDDDTVFAYANTRGAIDAARAALEDHLAQEGRHPTTPTSHGAEARDEWRAVDPPPDPAEVEREHGEELEHAAEAERDARVETRTVAITSGKMVRNWFETTVADEARELGVELAIVEHPHLLSTQIVFTLTGPRGKIDQVIGDMRDRAGAATRLLSRDVTPFWGGRAGGARSTR